MVGGTRIVTTCSFLTHEASTVKASSTTAIEATKGVNAFSVGVAISKISQTFIEVDTMTIFVKVKPIGALFAFVRPYKEVKKKELYIISEMS